MYYQECVSLMQKAATEDEGWSITFIDEGPARLFRLDCLAVRRAHKSGGAWEVLDISVEKVEDNWAVLARPVRKILQSPAQIIGQGPISELKLAGKGTEKILRGDAIQAASERYAAKILINGVEAITRITLFNDGKPGARMRTEIWADLPEEEQKKYH